jgi:hypothetical protein
MNCDLSNLANNCCIDTAIGGIDSIYLAKVSDVDYLNYTADQVSEIIAKPGKSIIWNKFNFNKQSISIKQDIVSDKFNLIYNVSIMGKLTGLSADQMNTLKSFVRTPTIAILKTKNNSAIIIGYREGLKLGNSNFSSGQVSTELYGFNLMLEGSLTHHIYILDNIDFITDPCSTVTTPTAACVAIQTDMVNTINDLLDAEKAYADGNSNIALSPFNLDFTTRTYTQIINLLGVTPVIHPGWQIVRYVEANVLEYNPNTDFRSQSLVRVSSGNYLLSDAPTYQTRANGVYSTTPLSDPFTTDFINPAIVSWVAVPVSATCAGSYPITGAIAQMKYEDYATSTVFYRSFSSKIIAISPDAFSPYPVIEIDYSSITNITLNQTPTMTNNYSGQPFCTTFQTQQINALSTPVSQLNRRNLTPYKTYNFTFTVYTVQNGAFVNLQGITFANGSQPAYSQLFTGIYAGQVITGTCFGVADVKVIAFRCEISGILFTC